MPNPVSQDQTVTAINTVLATMDPPTKIPDLGTDQMSDPNWSCNNFSPAVLDQICILTGTNPEDLNSVEYTQGAALPAGFADGSFVNISMLGEPSALNHNFNILVSGGITYLSQAYVGQSVNIVRRFDNADFITLWQNLSNNVDWTDAYNELFGVAPATVLGGDPPENTWLTSQWVTQ